MSPHHPLPFSLLGAVVTGHQECAAYAHVPRVGRHAHTSPDVQHASRVVLQLIAVLEVVRQGKAVRVCVRRVRH